MFRLPDDSARLRRALWPYGLDLFNMTEVSVPDLLRAEPAAPGTCGKQRPGVDLRIVDVHDREVPVGEIGELIVRTESPGR